MDLTAPIWRMDAQQGPGVEQGWEQRGSPASLRSLQTDDPSVQNSLKGAIKLGFVTDGLVSNGRPERPQRVESGP